MTDTSDEQPTTPNQMTVDDLLRFIDAKSIPGDTPLTAIVGSVGSSKELPVYSASVELLSSGGAVSLALDTDYM